MDREKANLDPDRHGISVLRKSLPRFLRRWRKGWAAEMADVSTVAIVGNYYYPCKDGL
jgi:hypothetical protein